MSSIQTPIVVQYLDLRIIQKVGYSDPFTLFNYSGDPNTELEYFCTVTIEGKKQEGGHFGHLPFNSRTYLSGI